jgi:hypothetical protein
MFARRLPGNHGATPFSGFPAKIGDANSSLLSLKLALHPLLDVLGSVLEQVVDPVMSATFRDLLDEPCVPVSSRFEQSFGQRSSLTVPTGCSFDIGCGSEILVAVFIGDIPKEFQCSPREYRRTESALQSTKLAMLG